MMQDQEVMGLSNPLLYCLATAFVSGVIHMATTRAHRGLRRLLRDRKSLRRLARRDLVGAGGTLPLSSDDVVSFDDFARASFSAASLETWFSTINTCQLTLCEISRVAAAALDWVTFQLRPLGGDIFLRPEVNPEVVVGENQEAGTLEAGFPESDSFAEESRKISVPPELVRSIQAFSSRLHRLAQKCEQNDPEALADFMSVDTHGRSEVTPRERAIANAFLDTIQTRLIELSRAPRAMDKSGPKSADKKVGRNDNRHFRRTRNSTRRGPSPST